MKIKLKTIENNGEYIINITEIVILNDEPKNTKLNNDKYKNTKLNNKYDSSDPD